MGTLTECSNRKSDISNTSPRSASTGGIGRFYVLSRRSEPFYGRRAARGSGAAVLAARARPARLPDGAADQRNAARHGGRVRLAVRRARVVGMARLELVPTLRGGGNAVRRLRILHAILRNVRAMGQFFFHAAISTVMSRPRGVADWKGASVRPPLL